MMRRAVRFLAALAAFAVAAGAPALACAVCYGDPEAPAVRGLNLAIVALGLITAGVLAGITAFAIRMNRRAKEWQRVPGEGVKGR